MKTIFYKIGFFSSSNPWIALIFCVSLTTILGLGMYNLHIETDPQELWVSPDSRTYKEQQDFASNFGPFYRTNQFMILPRHDIGSNIFQKEALYIVYYIQQIIKSMSVEKKGKNITLDDLCFKPVSGKGCLIPSPMDIWLQDPVLLQKDNDIQRTTLCTQSVDLDRTSFPCSDENGIPVIKEAVFSGITCQPRFPDDQPCDHCYINATSMAVTYLLNNDKFSQKDAQAWELDVFMLTMQKFNNKDHGWLKDKYKGTWEIPSDESINNYKVVYLSERSIPDELDNETTQNAWVVVLSYILMFIYISIALGEFPSGVFNGFLLGFGGILIVAASMVGSIGIVSYLNVGMTMISAEVIPFLILAIGVDNMFIIIHASQGVQNASSLQDKMGRTLQIVGPSITTAAVCETLAFLVGALTKMPALQTFCLQAAFGVLLDYIFQLTVFIAFFTWDEIRRDQKRYDCLFCIKASNSGNPPNRQIAKKIVIGLNKVLYTTPCKLITFLVFGALFVVSCAGAYNLENGLEEQVSMVSDSDLFNYFTNEKRYIEVGPPAYLVLKGMDYEDAQDLELVSRLSNALSQLNTTVQPPIYSWVAAFNLFRKGGQEWVGVCGTADIMLDEFPNQLKRFVETKITSPCCQRFGLCGEQFQADIVTNDTGYVETSRLRFQHKPIHGSAEYILTFEQTRQVIDKLTTDLKEGQSVYAYSLPYIFYDQYSYIKAVAIQNVMLALAIIFLTVTVIQDAICALIVTITVFIISFNLIGLVWLLNIIIGGFQVQINAISVVNLVTCIGLAVEFCAHLVIKFRNTAGDNRSRAQYSMQTIGTSVLVGIASTKFIGVIVLAFASSTLFRLYYFRMYILMVLIGTFNGLCLLPICLEMFGPAFIPIRRRPSKNIIVTDSQLSGSLVYTQAK